MSPSSDISDFLNELRWEDVPERVQNRVRFLLLDLLGTALAGTGTELHAAVLRYATRNLAGDHVRVLFSGVTLSPEGAALVGAMTIDSVDAHDGHRLTKGHVGCGVLPALLTILDDRQVTLSGEDFLMYLAAGYEIGTRAGIALHRTASDYHTSGAWIAVCVAAISGRLMGLSPDVYAHALGIAEYHGPRSQMMRVIDHPTMLKDGSGWGAMTGISAAALADAGFTGAPAITVLAPEVSDIWGTLGAEWEVLNQYIKGFPVCRWAQPSVQAALDLTRVRPLRAEDIVSVEIETFHEGTRLFKGVPSTTEEAQYAIGFPVAAALLRGRVGVAEISKSAFCEPDLCALCEGLSFKENDAFNALFPAERWAKLSVRLSSGEVLTTPATQAKGDPETPYTEAEITAKFYDLAGEATTRPQLEAIHAAVMGLDETGASLIRLQDQIFAKP
ncbi:MULTISPECIES: MmgE/PrpD family protein [Pacificibacter]|uniref:MmgE/PrpD family protein n=1 Tax=Pacificibacter TaxID=1042323 RepID=UPI001C08ADDF|nr:MULTISPECIES: MmgE/PrpD family protein [Pacificibacter]MBU2937189.1 MmgE/PrpD family protein [Pacificibacter marinus]MDO6616992.1 MmgE/PrpD family protein [Pacificibacter sp. 1_MG-2023]